MQRREILHRISVVSAGGMTALAGCSSTNGGGVEGEVVTNELSDKVTIHRHRLENKQILGSDAVACIVTVENTTSSKISIGLDVKMFNGDTVVAHDDYTVNKELESGAKIEVEEAHQGRKKDVTRYEVAIIEDPGY